jgi:uncharacterized protein YdeI (YjbR/CyaY-like superfamily)
MAANLQFFATPADWRAWLQENHGKAQELWVGFYKRNSGRSSITWPEAVDGALCYGWIDGIRKSIDDVSYKIRFTPRKPRSVWSAVNVRRVSELTKLGLMHQSGLDAFKKRQSSRSEIYAYEQNRKAAVLPRAYTRQFQSHPVAWEYFQAQAAWYRRTASWWVISAKKDETRLKRLTTLIDCSGRKKSIPALTRPSKKT